MNRISRTIALSAAAVLALGIAACSPTNQKNSDAPQITTVSPDSGLKGAGQAETSSNAEAGSTDTGSAADHVVNGTAAPQESSAQ